MDGESVVSKAARLIEREQYRDAAALLSQRVQADPHDYRAWEQLSVAHFELQEWTEAEHAARQVVRLRPDSPKAHSNLGTTLRKQGRDAEAAGAQRTALELDPDYRRSLVELRKLGKRATPLVPSTAPASTLAYSDTGVNKLVKGLSHACRSSVRVLVGAAVAMEAPIMVPTGRRTD